MSIVVRFHPTNATRRSTTKACGGWRGWNLPNPPDSKSTLRSGLTTTCVSARSGVRARSSRHGEKLMPILSDMGIEFSAEPEIFEVQNLIK